MQAPPGAPYDPDPPVLVAATPDSGTIVGVFDDDDVEFQFDEVIAPERVDFGEKGNYADQFHHVVAQRQRIDRGRAERIESHKRNHPGLSRWQAAGLRGHLHSAAGHFR